VQVDELQVGETRHRFGVVRLWEQDPLPLLQNPALLPLANLGPASYCRKQDGK
jgi:hypothetical protein